MLIMSSFLSLRDLQLVKFATNNFKSIFTALMPRLYYRGILFTSLTMKINTKGDNIV